MSPALLTLYHWDRLDWIPVVWKPFLTSHFGYYWGSVTMLVGNHQFRQSRVFSESKRRALGFAFAKRAAALYDVLRVPFVPLIHLVDGMQRKLSATVVKID